MRCAVIVVLAVRAVATVREVCAENAGGLFVGRAERRAAGGVLEGRPPVLYASGGFRRTAKAPIMRFLVRAGVKSGPCRGVNALGRGRGSFSAPREFLPKNHQD